MEMLKSAREKIALALISLLSALLNLVNLGIEGYSNQYYAAGVKSMLVSWKNFFFVALDPAGFVSVDKPPLGYWIQALSAKIFGFSGWSILLPQALAGVASVIVIYFIVKRSFGTRAGLISALCLAITPVFVAVSRNNTVDNLLVLALLLACWAVSVAAEKGSLKYLILTMILIGIGFNIKMLQAYMILPAIYVLYLFSNTVSLPKRIGHLLIGTMVLAVVSLSWALVVDSIPASERPYVGCSTNNTVMQLITGHNGTERLGGIFGIFTGSSNNGSPGAGPGGGGAPRQRLDDNSDTSAERYQNRPQPPMFSDNQGQTAQSYMDRQSEKNSSYWKMPQGGMPFPQSANDNGMTIPPGGEAMRPPNNFGGAPGGGPGGNGLAGTFGNQTPAGITRLFQHNVLSDQIVWFIPLALFGFLAAAYREKLRLSLDNKRKQALALWFMWFLPIFIYFSYNTGLFHSYYLTMLAPPVAALAGIGLVSMWEMYKKGGWNSWLLPLALLANGSVQILMLSYFYSSSTVMIQILMGLLSVVTFIPALGLMALNISALIKKRRGGSDTFSEPTRLLGVKRALATLAVVGLLIVPGTGSAAAMFQGVNGAMPGAGLELLPDKLWSGSSSDQLDGVRKIRMGNRGEHSQNHSALIAFLKKHPVNGKPQIVVSSANTAETITLNSDVYVASLSGFMGSQPVMSLARFKELVAKGEVRYVLADGGYDRGGGPGGGASGSAIMNWVKKTGKLVSYSGSSGNSGQVYDLIGYTRNQAN
ncbi:MAG: glycosyltransferase family 39 protein [Deltaproteobacteria bacterium]